MTFFSPALPLIGSLMTDSCLLFLSKEYIVPRVTVMTDMRFFPCFNWKPILHIAPSMTKIFFARVH